MFTHNRPITLVAVLFFTLLMLATALAVGQAADAASEFRIRILAQIKSKDSHGFLSKYPSKSFLAFQEFVV